MNKRIAIFRRLIAKYWQPLTLLGSAVTAILNLLKLAQDAGIQIPIENLPLAGRLVGTTQGDIILRVVIFVGVFIIIRFPGIAIFITRIILGRPEAPANLPRLFRGPRPYDEEDFGKLPGRQKEIDDCSIDIRSKPFYILEGESGCGKSSILNAALLPEFSRKFQVVKCRVAEDPFGKLLAALQNKAYGQIGTAPIKPKAILDAVSDAVRGFEDQSDQIQSLLVCIDQFEELFVTVPAKVRAQFIKTMKDAIATYDIRLVIVIRSDFRDLLDKVCREIDPQQTVLDLSSYYILKSFNQKQAQDIIHEILKPFYQDDPVLQHECDTFSDLLVDELLRPPRDKRLNSNDEMSVLPVELQTIGFMLESTGVQNFSSRKLREMGGKIGLLREFIENAKNHVWHKTGVAGKDSLRILRYLISPAETKWAQSPRAIGKVLNMPKAQVERALQGFAEKYLVIRLPGVSPKDAAAKDNDGFIYELMHEHLIQILIEAPDPILQKARDAKERLRFWVKRTASIFTETDKMSLPQKLARFFKMPVPLFESVKLWRFADQRDEQRLLKITLRGFLVRALLIVLPLTGWTIWTYTDSYQIRSIIADAPVAETAADRNFNSIYEVQDYLKIVVKLKQTEQALAAARDISDADPRSGALRVIATELAKYGQAEQALAIARNISDAFYLSEALRDIATELVKSGKTEQANHTFTQALAATSKISVAESRSFAQRYIAKELAKSDKTEQALAAARDISVAKTRSFALRDIAKELTKSDKTEQALATVRDISDDFYLSGAMRDIATELVKSGQIEQANRAITEALAAASDISNAGDRSRMLHYIATELTTSGQTEQALVVARDISDADDRSRALSDIATELIKAGQTEQANRTFTEALATAHNIKVRDVYNRSRALHYIATELVKAGQTEQALTTVRDISDAYYRSPALSDITTEMAKAGQTEQALAQVRYISDAQNRSRALRNIATELAKAGQTEQANRTFTWAQSAARDISGAESRSRALINIAMELATANEKERAIEGLEEVLSSSRKIDNVETRSNVLSNTAAGFARMGKFRKARHVAIECNVPENKLEAYTAILQAYYDLKYPDTKEEKTN